MRYRDATDADGDAVAAIIEAVFGEYDGCTFNRAAEYPDLDRVASTFANHEGGFWLAEDEAGRAVGCIGITRTADPDTFELHRLYVLPHARGTGASARLLAQAIRHAREHGAHRIILWTDTRFHSGQRFYERHGFVRLPGTRVLDDESMSQEYRYVLSLDAACPAGSALSASRSSRSPSAGAACGWPSRSIHGRHRTAAPRH
ncbi:GNAT family N-acetyltransferase [Caenispirillum salinarum]|uniref:GNAT family N-acetyltransferase n=1 Tax=Caenispirillum salinarum TaxID=859058 RepID=UPI00384E4327